MPAASLATPLDLADSSADKRQNLLVLQQSLDDDGDAANGIKISPSAAAAVTTRVDVDRSVTMFA